VTYCLGDGEPGWMQFPTESTSFHQLKVHQRPIDWLIIDPNKKIDSAHGCSSAIADHSDAVAQPESFAHLVFLWHASFSAFLIVERF